MRSEFLWGDRAIAKWPFVKPELLFIRAWLIGDCIFSRIIK